MHFVQFAEAPVILFDGTPHYEFKIVLLDKCIQKLVASGKKVCLWDIFKGEDDLEEFKAMVEAEIARNKQANSPLFKQFCDLKKNHPDALLLFRSGDVYKCYEVDAIKAAEVLCLTDIVEEDKITVASFPHHSLDTYLPRLIRHGIRASICDQLESPKQREQNQACLNSAESRRTGSKAEAPKPKKQALLTHGSSMCFFVFGFVVSLFCRTFAAASRAGACRLSHQPSIGCYVTIANVTRRVKS